VRRRVEEYPLSPQSLVTPWMKKVKAALEFTKQTNGIRLEQFVKRVRSLVQE
jgi:hypothetical protein